MSFLDGYKDTCGCKGTLRLQDYMQERFKVSAYTHIVTFKDTPSFSDPIIANACVRVCTSDGKIGTLSHLGVSCNPIQFAIDLREFLNKNGVPVILNGGSQWPPSYELTTRLYSALKDRGFKVPDSLDSLDVFGSYSRKATLEQHGVTVTRVPDCGSQQPEILFFKFPK